MLTDLPENRLTDAILGAAFEVHKVLGPGLKEEVYEAALAVELGLRGIRCRRQVPVPVVYKGVDIGDPQHPKRIDVLVEESVVVECKALATAKDPVFRAQCLTYLKMTGLKVGLVLNFGRPTLKEGIDRVIHDPSSVPNNTEQAEGPRRGGIVEDSVPPRFRELRVSAPQTAREARPTDNLRAAVTPGTPCFGVADTFPQSNA